MMSYNSQNKLRDNIIAIRIALEWKVGQSLSNTEVEALKRYAGFGGLKAILFPNALREEWIKLKASKEDLKLHPQILELHQLLQQHLSAAEYNQTIDSIKNSILTAFYTPAIIPQTLFEVLKQNEIYPKTMYEPSSGSGVFVTEAVNAFAGLENITAVEKDILSGKVLTALGSSLPIPVSIQVTGFENTSDDENEKYDLIVSNIPFGNFPVHDVTIKNEALTGKIHNYFFAKGLDKIKEGGLLAYITTDAFLNSPSNQVAREYLFNHADFISLNVLPDNLMKDTGNTEASSHLLIVQKNTNKESLSENESLLISTLEEENEFGKYNLNSYIHRHPEIILGNEIRSGTNQYGKAHQTVWQNGDISLIKEKLAETISNGINLNLNKDAFLLEVSKNNTQGKRFTYLRMPESKADNGSVQLGLFDVSPVASVNRAIDYINSLDATIVDKKTARIVNLIKTTDKPEHEAFVMLAAKSFAFKQYVYKLYSNIGEVPVPANWISASAVHHELICLSNKLSEYNYRYFNEGEGAFHINTKSEDDQLEELRDLNPYYKEGTLLVHNNRIGFVTYTVSENKNTVFLPAVKLMPFKPWEIIYT